jgi:hypothetical protein
LSGRWQNYDFLWAVNTMTAWGFEPALNSKKGRFLMTRGRKGGLSIMELEGLLQEKRAAVQKLHRQRAELQRKLDQVDREITRLGGSTEPRTAGGRVRNGVSLVAAMEAVLRGKPPMGVGEILEAVLAGGYQSTSANFRGLINQTLIKEKQFKQMGRGVYTAK